MSKQILLVVDISNLYFSVKHKYDGKKVDFAKLKKEVEGFGELHRAIAYGSRIGDQAEQFIAMLQSQGYETRYKEVKTFANGRKKADWDVGIAMDVVRMIKLVDIVIIVSADGDFSELVHWIREQGRVCYVYGCNISGELKGVADKYFNVGHLLTEDQNEALHHVEREEGLGSRSEVHDRQASSRS